MERLIPLDGCFNFRDLGGYPTADGRRIRWRRLFRSDALHHLTPEAVGRFVDDLGIRHVVDLRSTGEIEAEGRGLVAETEARFHHLPLFDGAIDDERQRHEAVTLADRYYLMAEFAKDPIARVIETLARADAPAVYHCAAGKDRTGVISAILLGLLGVRDEIIIADYAATQENLDAIIDRLMNAQGYQEMFEMLPADTLHANPETMVNLLERLREQYGSFDDYVLDSGVSRSTLDNLRTDLLT